VSLKDWLKNGWLIEHRTSPQEIKDLLSVVDRDLADSRASGLSPDGRLNISYNAALQAAHAALAACGYRSSRDAHHYRVIQSLAYTIEADAMLIIQFDKFRKKRNIGGYERAGLVSDQEAGEIFSLAKRLRMDVEQWLHQYHPALLKK
jgi:hypothetical protein